MTAKYDRNGLKFIYPENWAITEDNEDSGTRSVYVQAPGGAFWSVDVHLNRNNSRIVAAEMLNSMQHEYADLESEAVEVEIAGRHASGYEMHFYCMDLVVSSRVLTLPMDYGTIALQYQAESREFAELEPVFRAITESIFRPELLRRNEPQQRV